MILLLLSLLILRASDPYSKDVSGEGRFVLSGNPIKIAVQVLEEGKPVADKRVLFRAHNNYLYRRDTGCSLHDG